MGRGNKFILIMELEAFPSCCPTKTKEKLTQGTFLRESLKKGNLAEVLLNTKKQKIHTKTISKRASVAMKVPLHPR